MLNPGQTVAYTALFACSLMAGKASATDAMIGSAPGLERDCGPITSASRDAGVVTVIIPGINDCYPTDPGSEKPLAVPYDFGTVNEGSSRQGNVTDLGIVVQLPISQVKAVIHTPPQYGEAVVINNTEIQYTPPVVAQLGDADADTPDPFEYHIEDARGASFPSDPATLNVTINWVDESGGGDECENSATINCMPVIWTFPNYETSDDLLSNKTNVYPFDYDGESGLFSVFGWPSKDVAITDSPTSMTMPGQPNCTATDLNPMWFHPVGSTRFGCYLEPGKRYFYHLKNQDGSGSGYFLTVAEG